MCPRHPNVKAVAQQANLKQRVYLGYQQRVKLESLSEAERQSTRVGPCIPLVRPPIPPPRQNTAMKVIFIDIDGVLNTCKDRRALAGPRRS